MTPLEVLLEGEDDALQREAITRKFIAMMEEGDPSSFPVAMAVLTRLHYRSMLAACKRVEAACQSEPLMANAELVTVLSALEEKVDSLDQSMKARIRAKRSEGGRQASGAISFIAIAAAVAVIAMGVGMSIFFQKQEDRHVAIALSHATGGNAVLVEMARRGVKIKIEEVGGERSIILTGSGRPGYTNAEGECVLPLK